MIYVSVIIPVYNAALLLDRCLDSVFSQHTKYTFEVILIDDGSTDNSVEIIKQRSEKNIVLIQQQNAGPATARNKGIEVAKGEFISFLDADDYWMPEFINETVNFMRLNSETVAVSVGQIHKSVSCSSRTQPAFLNEDKELSSFIIKDFFHLWKDQEIVCTGSVLLKAQIAKLIFGQREDLRVNEDLEFWACISAFGKWGFIPKILFVSDGMLITQQIGWFEKNIKRWQSAPTIEDWEKRIVELYSNRLPESYYLFRGKIISGLVYSMILSNRKTIAYNMIKKYGTQLPNNMRTKIYKLVSISKISWNIFTYFMIKREHNRNL